MQSPHTLGHRSVLVSYGSRSKNLWRTLVRIPSVPLLHNTYIQLAKCSWSHAHRLHISHLLWNGEVRDHDAHKRDRTLPSLFSYTTQLYDIPRYNCKLKPPTPTNLYPHPISEVLNMTKEIVLQTIKRTNRSGPHLLKYLKTNFPDI